MSSNDEFNRDIFSDDTARVPQGAERLPDEDTARVSHDDTARVSHEDTARVSHDDTTRVPHDDTTRVSHDDTTYYGDSAVPQHAEAAQPRTLSRPKGPSWGTVALGLICLVVAAGAFWVEWSNLSLDWTRSLPLTMVGLGIILVLVGLAALLRRNEDDDELDRGLS